MSRYDVKSIANSNLPIGGISGKSKNSSDSTSESKSMDGCKSSADDRDHLSSASSVTFVSPTANSPLGFTMPVKQDPSDFWSNILGCRNTSITTSVSNNTKNETGNNVTFHSFSNPLSQVQPSIDVDFNVGSSVNCGNNNGILLNGGGGYYGGVGLSGGGGGGGSGGSNVSSTSSNLIPFAAPVALNSSSSNYEGSSNYGGWIAQSIHSLQSAKPNVSIFQTPIFGME
ncbi:hypothetical protein JCGZ_08659 [Jatropha curcas]|uniref:Uncharacterized protein n=2 Tax=Jatropha curcas TaxID=180498 RepID=A0A067KVT8_JATCU|nr:hypothetical protein JCGZ_08659 [Jatropha curcas]